MARNGDGTRSPRPEADVTPVHGSSEQEAAERREANHYRQILAAKAGTWREVSARRKLLTADELQGVFPTRRWHVELSEVETSLILQSAIGRPDEYPVGLCWWADRTGPTVDPLTALLSHGDHRVRLWAADTLVKAGLCIGLAQMLAAV